MISNHLRQLADEILAPYPIDLLPPIIRNAVEEYQAYGQQPVSIVACSALANVSLVCQGLADIARDEKLISPLSLYFVVVADSGERKTAADKIFTDWVKHWEQVTRDNLQNDVKNSKAAHDMWQAQREGILAAIKNPKRKIENIEELKQRLTALDLQEPSKIILPNLYHEETNAEALSYNLAMGWQSSSLWSDEAGIVVGGQGMNQDNITKFTTLLNRLWDGNAYRVNRKTSNSFVIEGRRLTCSLMMQPAVFEQLISRCSNISRGSGFLARCLISNPVSTMGNRFYRELPQHTPRLNIFYERMAQLLAKPFPLDDKQRLSPKILQLSAEAKALWVKFHDEIEAELRAVGKFWEIKDFAAKAAEHAVRLAGNFHVFDNRDGDLVDAETIRRAAGIIGWHLAEMNRIIETLEIAQEYKDAQLLLDWLKEKQYQEIKTNDLLRLAPYRLRNKERRDAAISVLQKHRYLTMAERNGTQFLILNSNVEHREQNSQLKK